MSQLTVESMNQHIVEAEYAVRGEIVLRAMEHEKALKRGEERPFDKVVFCNIGNPQALGQQPISFYREVLALLEQPAELDAREASGHFSEAAVARARALAAAVPSGLGAYSHSKGIEGLRRIVADFIEARDGHPADPEHVFLTDGASPAVQMLVKALIRGREDAIMVPIPQYPLYTASIALNGGTAVGYLLDETTWGLRAEELERALADAKRDGVNVRAVAVINPGNPTGQCLPVENMEEVVRFCEQHDLLLIADEVYQENIWNADRPFRSFKKVVADAGSPVQLASCHSVSKGFLGECGRRGGYVELHNFSEDVVSQLYKAASVNLCSNISGQVMTALMCSPPKPGEGGHDQFVAERDAILHSLRRRSRRLGDAFRGMEGVTCDDTDGSLYVFPQITLPEKAVAAAREAGKPADTFYCLSMLDETGVVVVPGSGFGQRENTLHFRTTILPPEHDIDAVAERMAAFHKSFLERYGGLEARL